jgi:hypothetical protein
MLDNNNGILNGFEITNTATTITIGEGNILIAGRPVGVVGSETVTAGTDVAYCKLVLEIDLTQQATPTTFEQASFKIIKSTTAYPEVTQENMDEGGNIYQVELARFRTTINGITEFQVTAEQLDYNAMQTQMKEQFEEKLAILEEELRNVESGSAYVLKTTYDSEKANFQKKITIGTEEPSGGADGDIYIQYFD